jgi:transcriptional regulator with XRE-family HTH domain
MTSILQIATKATSPKICRWHEDSEDQPSHNIAMCKFDRIAGNQLKLWRLAAGLTQSELADHIGTTASVVSLFETGGRKLSPKWLYSAAEVLKISPGTLLDKAPGEVDIGLIQTYNAIPAPQKIQALEILKTFVPDPEPKAAEPIAGTFKILN